MLDRLARPARRQFVATHMHGSTVPGLGPEDDSERIFASGACQTVQPDDLARPDVEGEVNELSEPDVANCQGWIDVLVHSALRLLGGDKLRHELVPDQLLHQPGAVDGVGVPGVDQASLAQDAYSMGERWNLVQ